MKKSFVATFWSVFDKVWTQFVSLLIGIVLARLLTPEDYGLVGICMVFIAFFGVFVEAGFSIALVRKLDRTQTDYSTTFYFNVIMGFVVYLVLFISAPWIAAYFDDERLIPLTRIVSISVIFNSFCIVQNAILIIGLRMKEQAFINMASQIPSGGIAIYLAYRGLGIYALAVQTVLAALINALLLWVRAKWHPSLEFSKESMKYLWGFGSKLLGSNILGTIYNEIYSVLIGKYVGKADLGLYSRGRSLAYQPDAICCRVVNKVVLPILSRYQDNPDLLKAKYKELTMLMMCTMTLISGVLICAAYPLILLVLGIKWTGAVPVFQLLVLAAWAYYISYMSLVLLQVANHTDYLLKLEFIKKPVSLLTIFFSLQYGLYGLLIAFVLNRVMETVVNMSAPWKYIKYTYGEQLFDIAKYIVAWIVGSIVVFGLSDLIKLNFFVDVFMRSVIMCIVYIGVLWLMKDVIMMKYGTLVWAKTKDCFNR